MKKILIIFLALCLLSSCALADTIISNESTNQTAETLVSYTIEACKEYTVTIPSSATIGDNQIGELTVSMDASKYQWNPGKKGVYFNVMLNPDQRDFVHPDHGEMYYLTNGTDQIGYTIQSDYYDDIFDVGQGLSILWVQYDENPEHNVIRDKAVLTLTAYPNGEESPGTYTTTLTFVVEVGEYDTL